MRPAIIIFGAAVHPGGVPSRTLRRRVEGALAFGRTLDNPLYVPTGGLGKHPPSEAAVMAGLLMQAGVPKDAILREDTAHDTMSSVYAVRALLRDHDGPVYAATSGYHLLRCVMLLRLAGIQARMAEPPKQAFRDVAYWWLREAAAIPYDLLLILWDRLRGKSPPD